MSAEVVKIGKGEYTVKGEAWSLPERYEVQTRVGSGAYGSVCKAHDSETGKVVAIKRIANVFISKTDALRILREISILRRITHKNIISLIDVPLLAPPPAPVKTMYVVFEFAGTDMHKMVHAGMHITIDQVKVLMKQLCEGIRYLHHSCVIHRDLKPANILVDTKTWVLKIADFGLSRVLEPGTTAGIDRREHHGEARAPGDESSSEGKSDLNDDAPPPPQMHRAISEHVVTRWYRAPEVILCRGHYGYSIDVWSAGCIFAELLNMQDPQPQVKKRPLFPGRSCFPLSPSSHTCFKDVTDQLNVIFNIIGTPSQEEIIRLEAGEDVKTYLTRLPPQPAVDLHTRFPDAPEGAIQILAGMLTFSAEERMTLDDVLDHDFLYTPNALEDKMELPILTRKTSSMAAEDLLALDLEHQYDRRNHDEAVQKLSALFRREIEGLHRDNTWAMQHKQNSEEFHDCVAETP
eukprot:CAMPEP_0206279016 /NCGR_PEP_ID=MMETSP0047_2-20121206/37777_1 /ASSEMBLY_ACC=CAM_ASM_000192 /TAXON_ID=195065 /ORGANISM="Chroomonas mesostigmatica_cf, Strain CCMP1168" /LENGTH=462 /DNA_ID=CAMNT_0053708897 /DNA_START=253 /DNA_END=1641 /DNA_ORIENTATION=-